MAASLSAVLTIPFQAIVGQRCTCILAVTNGGDAAANVTSIQPKVLPVGSPVTVTPPTVTPEMAVATTTGTQQQVTVNAGATVYFSFTLVVMNAGVQTGQAQQGAMGYQIGADVTDSTGALFSPFPQTLPVVLPQFGQPPGSPPNVSAARGELQFNLATNTVLAL